MPPRFKYESVRVPVGAPCPAGFEKTIVVRGRGSRPDLQLCVKKTDLAGVRQSVDKLADLFGSMSGLGAGGYGSVTRTARSSSRSRSRSRGRSAAAAGSTRRMRNRSSSRSSRSRNSSRSPSSSRSPAKAPAAVIKANTDEEALAKMMKNLGL